MGPAHGPGAPLVAAARGRGVPQVADTRQAAAVHLQDAVSQGQAAIRSRGTAREQGLDVEPGGTQRRMLGEKWRPQASVRLGLAPSRALPRGCEGSTRHCHVPCRPFPPLMPASHPLHS